ncbi:MAG: hypothetical protein B7Z66_11365 [Chromatiales bacterium 21-64-14]|nr:MAG: hypothetical protein B7Z66_11365 [Chromatiales bacterium 21-64-14]HQU16741.1 DMT family transporter [Gammaproteobacteria bacterium]
MTKRPAGPAGSSAHPALLRGALLALGSAWMFASMGAAVKVVSRELPTDMVVFFRSLFGLIALLPWLLHCRAGSLATRRYPLHLLRGLSGLTAMYCFFYALGHLSLAEAVLLNFTAPLFIAVIALLWLAEPVPPALRSALGTGFLGVILILKPGAGMFAPAALVGLTSGAFAGLSMVTIRRMADTEPTARIVFHYSTICTVVSAVPLFWSWHTPAPGLWLWLAAIGTLATAGQLLLTKAYSLAPAARVGPFTYASVVLAAGYGAWFWGEAPDRWTVAGALLISLAGILAIRRERLPAPLDAGAGMANENRG